MKGEGASSAFRISTIDENGTRSGVVWANGGLKRTDYLHLNLSTNTLRIPRWLDISDCRSRGKQSYRDSEWFRSVLQRRWETVY